MKNKILVGFIGGVIGVSLLSLAACRVDRTANKAEVMVKAQAPKATCKTATRGGVDIALCDVPGKDKIIPFIAVYGESVGGFKAYPLVDQEAPKPQTPPPAPVTTPDAGTGSAESK